MTVSCYDGSHGKNGHLCQVDMVTFVNDYLNLD